MTLFIVQTPQKIKNEIFASSFAVSFQNSAKYWVTQKSIAVCQALQSRIMHRFKCNNNHFVKVRLHSHRGFVSFFVADNADCWHCSVLRWISYEYDPSFFNKPLKRKWGLNYSTVDKPYYVDWKRQKTFLNCNFNFPRSLKNVLTL